MNNTQIDEKKKDKSNNPVMTPEKKDYWESKEKKAFPVYPELGEVSFSKFIAKIITGMFFSFLPSLFFVLGSPNSSFFYIWGIATIIVGGALLIMGGCRDLSRTSIKTSHKHYMKRVESTGEKERFKFELGMFKFGNTIEDFGAGACLFVIGFLLMSFT